MKVKKLTSCLLLGLVLSIGIGTVAKAYPHQGGDLNTGVVKPGNGYYMGYTYFYHANEPHWAQVRTNGKNTNAIAESGKTACANGPSVYGLTASIAHWAGKGKTPN